MSLQGNLIFLFSNSQYKYESPPLRQCLRLMFKNKNFIKFLISITSILVYLGLYGTIINEYFSQYGLTSFQTSCVSCSANFCASISSLVVSMKLDKSKNYKKTFIVLILLGLVSHCIMMFLIEFSQENAFYVLLVLWTCCTSSILPIYTCSMDYVVELTYPVGEAISAGLINTISQIFGVVIVKIFLTLHN